MFAPSSRRRRAATLIEFGLMLVLVVLVAVPVVGLLGSGVAVQFSGVTAALDGAGGDAPATPAPTPTPVPMSGDFDADATGPGGAAWPTTHIGSGSHDGSGFMNARALDSAVITFSPGVAVSADDVVSVTLTAIAQSGGTYWDLCTSPSPDFAGAVCQTMSSALPEVGNHSEPQPGDAGSWRTDTLSMSVPYGHAYAGVRFRYTVFYDDVSFDVIPTDAAGAVLDSADFDLGAMSSMGLAYPTAHYATGSLDGDGYMNARNGSAQFVFGPSYPVSAGHQVNATMTARTASGGGTKWHLCSAPAADMTGFSCTAGSSLPTSGSPWTLSSLTRTIPTGHAYVAIRFEYSVEYDLLRLVDLDD